MPLKPFPPIALALSLTALALTLTGCTSAPASLKPAAERVAGGMQGQVHGGQQPVAGAAIQLYAANTATAGGASTALLTPTVTTSDGTGVNNANANANNNYNKMGVGQFVINNADFTCPTSSSLVYITASGGNPGGAAVNPQLRLVVALGTCSNVAGIVSVNVNEVTTVGAAAALYPYTTSYSSISSSSANATALATAFNTTANEYSNYQTGMAPGPALPTGYSADTPDVNALANIMATCVNSSGGASGDGSSCGSFFALSKDGSNNAPTDTFQALLNIRNNPSRNVAALFNLQTGAAPFQPTNAAPPADYTLPITTVLASAPTFSPPGGAYTSVQNVALSDTDSSASIYYTTDGSTPGPSSTKYTAGFFGGSITVNQTETINAIAIDGSARSAVSTAVYTLSNLTPTVSLTAVTVPYQSTTATPITATSNSNGSVVTFATANGADGTFSPATCTIASGTCTVNYVPAGDLTKLSYPNGLTASFTAAGSYNAATASSTLTINPTFKTTVVASFTGTNGAAIGGSPYYGNLIQASDGNFYGTTYAGGVNGVGNIFKVTPSGVVTNLHSFNSNTGQGAQPDGYNPYSGLIQAADGNLYGTTYNGGTGYSNNAQKGGILFKLTLPGLAYSVVHNFNLSISDAKYPIAGVTQGTDGILYGTTTQGGANAYGTVYSIHTDGTGFTITHNFSSGTVLNTPDQGLIQASDGYFYGTASAGGASYFGGIFVINSTGSVYYDLHDFNGSATEGKYPRNGGTLTQGSDGYLYGVTQMGGNTCTANGSTTTCGTIFKITQTNGNPSNTFATVHLFTQAEGVFAVGALNLGSDGNFYSTTTYGGANSLGTIYSFSPSRTLTVVHNNTAYNGTPTDGNNYYGSFLQASDGNFYGLSYSGGTNNQGAIVKLTPTPALAAPMTLTLPGTVNAGSSFTVSYAVSNAYSATAQYCQFTLASAGNISSTTALTGTPNTQSATVNAPTTAGTYTAALTCGGQQSTVVTLNVTGAANTTGKPNPVPVF